jgi:hypothetical protein
LADIWFSVKISKVLVFEVQCENFKRLICLQTQPKAPLQNETRIQYNQKTITL